LYGRKETEGDSEREGGGGGKGIKGLREEEM
jgi:hypothetical protein